MRSIVAVITAGLVMAAGVAQAQSTRATHEDETGYVEGFAQSAFGNVTSQAYGLEGGLNVGPALRIYAELGVVRDTAPASLSANAQIIADYLSQAQSGVTYSAKQPVLLLGGGVRYVIPYNEKVEPYVLGGFGLGRVKRDVHYSVGDTDITDTLGTYGVVLGSDLSGTVTKPVLSFGGGLLWNLNPSLFLDVQYRFGRVFDDEAFTINRVGAGLGLRF